MLVTVGILMRRWKTLAVADRTLKVLTLARTRDNDSNQAELVAVAATVTVTVDKSMTDRNSSRSASTYQKR